MIPNEEQLILLKQKELVVLSEFDRVCTELGVSYWAHGGTLLGAVRHKGFIPWDDDIDVKMWYEDLQLLEKEWSKHSSSLFFLQTPRTDRFYLLPFAKVRLSGTSFVEESGFGKLYKQGIFIDIFPMFHFSGHEIAERKFALDYQRFWKSSRRGLFTKAHLFLKNSVFWVLGGGSVLLTKPI